MPLAQSNANGIPFGGQVPFDPSQIKVNGVKTLQQQLLTKQSPTLAGVITDESKNKGTARTIQLGRAYLFDGSDDRVAVGAFGNITKFKGYIRFNIDDQNIWSLDGTTGSRIRVTGGVLTFGPNLTGTTIKVDDVTKTASEAGVLLNDNTWHLLEVTFNSFNATDLMLGRGTTGAGTNGNLQSFGWEFYNGSTLVALYKMDEQAGTTCYDSSGNAKHGTIENATLSTFHSTQNIYSYQNEVGYSKPASVFIPRNEAITTQDVTGASLEFTGRVPYNGALEQSSAIQLNGTTQYGSVSYNALFNITNNLSVSIRAKNDDATISAIETLIGRYNPAENKRYWALAIDADEKLSLFLSSDGINVGVYTSTSAIAINTAKTYGFTFASGSVKLFVDGVEVAGSVTAGSIPATIGNATDLPLTIGCIQQSAPTLFFDGQLYDARIYSTTVLTASEMLAIHNGTETTLGATIVAHYPMSCGAGALMCDVSGNALRGTLINTPTVTLQNTYHYNLVKGFSQYYFDGDTDNVALGTAIGLDEGDIFEFTASLLDDSGHVISKSADTASRIWLTPTTVTIQDSSANISSVLHGITNMAEEHTYRLVGVADFEWEVYVDGVLKGTTSGLTNVLINLINIGGRNFASAVKKFTGNIKNVKYYNEGVLTGSWTGGITTASWLDTTGSNNGTITSPMGIKIPARNTTTDIAGIALTNPAGTYHNGAETLIDFTNNVLSPVAVINSWETAWAFNTARTNPEFKRTLTSGGVEHRADRFLAYRDALSGTNLTKVQNYTATKAI